MLGFSRRRLQILFPSRSNAASSLMHPHVTRLYTSKPMSGSTQDEKDGSFAVSYLVDSCGLSPELALSLYKKKRVRFASPEKPDSVVKLLREYGFGETHVSKIVKKLPEMLSLNAEKILLPKLEFFVSVGITGTALAEALSGNPIVLRMSLENTIRPCYAIIRTLGIPNGRIPRFIKYSPYSFNVKALGNVARNVPFLRSLKVPESTLDLCRPHNLLAVSTDAKEFDENVNKVISMGFSPSSFSFMKALYVSSVLEESKLEQRKEFYKKSGWNESDILLAFSKYPSFMVLSEEKFSSKMDFLVNKMGLQPAEVAKYPWVLLYSLEEWIIPRYSVIKVLLLKGLIRLEQFSLLGTALMCKKDYFLHRFVNKHQEQVPELLSIFHGKVGLAELGLEFEETDGVKQI
ncbi:transcription termination factor MTERF15, mitochondrial-like [Argentina anserina]|uniref:transcription termination factor MTERF15, mitochondrial-like n=1 Tax=Argentina anserina TaxID=57926 RepID=UPI0021766EC7|nr:transcription termination factor MTERF15, mitochondrial-like [Potentilla anserina]